MKHDPLSAQLPGGCPCHTCDDDRWFDANRQPCARCHVKSGDLLSGAWLCFDCALVIVRGAEPPGATVLETP